MQETIQKQPWAVAAMGLVLIVIGTLGSNSQSLSGNPVQLVFDIAAIAGWVLLVGGIVMYVKARRKPDDHGKASPKTDKQ